MTRSGRSQSPTPPAAAGRRPGVGRVGARDRDRRGEHGDGADGRQQAGAGDRVSQGASAEWGYRFNTAALGGCVPARRARAGKPGLERDDIDPSARVLAERAQLRDSTPRARSSLASRPGLAGRQLPEAEVGVGVAPVERAQCRVSHDVAARDGARPALERVLEHQADMAGRILAGVVWLRSLERRPAELPSPGRATRSTSSIALWPTSPIDSEPVSRSNEKRHGLRSP